MNKSVRIVSYIENKPKIYEKKLKVNKKYCKFYALEICILVSMN